MNEITEKWGKVGLLGGIDSQDNKDTMAQLFDDCAKMLIATTITGVNENQDRLETMMLPILRRVMVETNFEYEPNLNFLYQFLFRELYTNNEVKFYLENCTCYNGPMDCEAEATLMLSDLVITELENGRLL
jgi:hypothetical protein